MKKKSVKAKNTVKDLGEIKNLIVVLKQNHLKRHKLYLNTLKLAENKLNILSYFLKKDHVNEFFDHKLEQLKKSYKKSSLLLNSPLGKRHSIEKEMLNNLEFFNKVNFDQFLFQFQELVKMKDLLKSKKDIKLLEKIDELKQDPTNSFTNIDGQKLIEINYEFFEKLELSLEEVKLYKQFVSENIRYLINYRTDLIEVENDFFITDGKIEINQKEIESINKELVKLKKQVEKLRTKNLTKKEDLVKHGKKIHDVEEKRLHLKRKKKFAGLIQSSKNKNKILSTLMNLQKNFDHESLFISEQLNNVKQLEKEMKKLEKDYNFDKYFF